MKTRQKNQIFHTLSSFLPDKVIRSRIYKKKPDTQKSFKAVLLFADISGFTAMSEKLSRLGKEGAEEVNKIINKFFDPLIKIIYKWDGDIYRFSGDAFLALFPEAETGLSASERAINAGIEILNFLERLFPEA